MRIALTLLTLVAIVSLTSACSSNLAQPGNWEEKDWPHHDYKDVAEMASSVLSAKFGYKIIGREEDKGEHFIEFSSLWNDAEANQGTFTGSGKRRKVWVQVEEVALDLRYDPRETEMAEVSKYGKSRIVERDGRFVKLVTRLAISCLRERNDSTPFADDPSRAEWRSDGYDDNAVAHYMDEISRRLRDKAGIEFDVSPRASKIYLEYFRESELTPEEKKARNKERSKRIGQDLENARNKGKDN